MKCGLERDAEPYSKKKGVFWVTCRCPCTAEIVKKSVALLNLKQKDIEKTINLKIRNGQSIEAIRKTLYWVIENT